MTTDREKFLSVLFTSPLAQADAVVVLCGEDTPARLQVGGGLMRGGASEKLILSGGRDEPPHMAARTALGFLVGDVGVNPTRIQLDDDPQNTREQAVSIAEMAKENEWGQVLLVASTYHLPRAFLTVLKAVKEAGLDEELRVIPVPASHVAWSEAPPDMYQPRIELLDRECAKVDEYADHVCTYAEGVEYLLRWEGA